MNDAEDFLARARTYSDAKHPEFWEVVERNALDEPDQIRNGETPEQFVERLVDLHDAHIEKPS